jgi:hypothetical protein
MSPINENHLQSVVDAQVFGARSDWEKHEIAGQASFVKPIHTHDAEMKARIASRFDELGFIPKFFREGNHEFVALEGVRGSRYHDVEAAFVEQILKKL